MMNGWIYNCNIQMANNLIKWWRNKFLNGYKPFTVDFNDGRVVSDTEELLGRISEDETSARMKCPNVESQQRSTTTTQQSTTTTSQQQNNHHLNLEEFSCDVSVEGGLDKSGQERQEFSFTLYDFDGHGKITKDDIAGLVTTIYEALGTTVKVPHYGSKTIRVKLTVSPDQRKHVSAKLIQQDRRSDDKNQNDEIRYKRDLNVTIQQRSHEKTRPCQKRHKQKKHSCQNHKVDADDVCVSDDNSDAESHSSGPVTSEDEDGKCTENQHFKCNRARLKKSCTSVNPQYTVPKLFKDPSRHYGCPKTKKTKKRSSTLQRQELLEIIQANMDKNNLGFQPFEKPCTNHTSLQNKQTPQQNKQQKVQKRTISPLQYLTSVVNPTHFYVDLASLQNTANLTQTHCKYDRLIDAVMCVSNKKASPNKHQTHQDCPHHLQNTCPNNNTKTTKKLSQKVVTDCEKTQILKKSVKKIPQIVLGHTSSPHHLRHRNRQEDQARAMAQVVRWLEQEFSSNTNSNDKEECTTNKQQSKPTSPNSGIERHEHHHVHEHIHHHYHHYQDTPLVV